MDKVVFTEEFCRPENLHPFTLTRQLQDIRVGILTIREKWEKLLGMRSFDKKEDDYKDLDLSIHITDAVADGSQCYMVHGNVLPTPKLLKATKKLKGGEFISVKGIEGVVFRLGPDDVVDRHRIKITKAISIDEELPAIKYPWDILRLNEQAIRMDFELITRKRKSQPLPRTNQWVNPSDVFVEKGAVVEHSIINASTGPVYIGRNAHIMEGCMIRGPFALCEGAVLKMGTKVYGATTLGPYCIGGGEIKNSVMFGYSNKAHDGYLGDSVIGEWCNLGAGTTNSNLKNTGTDVLVWTKEGQVSAGPKCGVIMGDYTRTAINTSINTGTVIGACCHVFGAGLTPKYIPSFSWGSEGIRRYEFGKALDDIASWKAFKGRTVSENEKLILKHIFEKL